MSRLGPDTARSVAFHARIYLCTDCEIIAKEEWEKEKSGGTQKSDQLCILALAVTIIGPIIVTITALTVSNASMALFLSLGIQTLVWTQCMTASRSKQRISFSNPRRLYVDWDTNHRITFTNRKLMQAFQEKNPRTRVKYTDSVVEDKLESATLGDIFAGCCASFFGLGIVSWIILFLAGKW